MRIRDRVRSLGSVLALVAGLTLAGAADARPPGPGHSFGGMIERHAERLGLSEETRAAIQGIVEASGARDAALHEQLEQAHQRMRELLSGPTPALDAVMSQAEAIGALETGLHKNRLQAILEIRTLLTPEQRDELIRIREERPRRFHRDNACARDLDELCAQADSGRAALACLEKRWDELSPPCRESFEAGAGRPSGHP
jgi:Spy/CpxP family protein refolding chaperone